MELANDIQMELSTNLWCFLLKVIKSPPLHTLQAFKTPCLQGSVALLIYLYLPWKVAVPLHSISMNRKHSDESL